MSLAAAPPNLHPEEEQDNNNHLFHRGFIYFDTDLDPSTGESIGGIGADYRLTPVFYTFRQVFYLGAGTISSGLIIRSFWAVTFCL